MREIQFTVLDGWPPSSGISGTFILVSDNWDDFNFKTLYNLYYIKKTDEIIDIGHVKVASLGMEEGDPHTELPHKFSHLPKNFFSLGQSREYYQALNALPDNEGDAVLKALRDVAADEKIYGQIKDENVFTSSLLRDIPVHTVTSQFRRISKGHAPLTPYKFYYQRKFNDEEVPDLRLEFNVNPESTPPTNLHVLIGANGVGKSMLLRDMVSIASGRDNTFGTLYSDTSALSPNSDIIPFVNVVHVSYSAFDKNDEPSTPVNDIKVHIVGLSSKNKSLGLQFSDSFRTSSMKPRRERLINSIRTLEHADPILADASLSQLLDSSSDINDSELLRRFESMSSGHKIAILTVTRLVELVEEQSLVLLDEPETHLHPPLLSALTRAISDLIIDRNGVAIIATHSPVVLQEVPKSCVWRLQRNGEDLRAFRLAAESFGESVSRLTSEVFHLDVRRTGYHNILRQLVDQTGSVDSALEILSDQLGDEGRFVLNSLAYQKDEDHV